MNELEPMSRRDKIANNVFYICFLVVIGAGIAYLASIAWSILSISLQTYPLW